MDVQLYVYDLTHGMARNMSRQLLGIQIDAVYHTSLVIDGIEYFFGAGVQTCYAGQTHHGRPMEVVPMGQTHLPIDVILEYLESLKQIYTPESYDLFAHNCNNFTNDFGMFLVGKGIPNHITSLPKRVLDTPFGQMLKPQIDAGMRSITQAEVPSRNRPIADQGRSQPAATTSRASPSDMSDRPFGRVFVVDNASTFEQQMASASNTCMTVFFTSSTCAPCRIAYPMFDNLAGEHSQALFVKVDINSAQGIAAKYQIRATPTFMTFLNGVKQDEWTGADPALLKSNVERLIQQRFPPHPHSLVKAPTLQYGSMKPVTFAKVPPLDKLMGKLSHAARQRDFGALRSFIEKRNVSLQDAPLPDLQSISASFARETFALPVDTRFAAVDLLRCAMIDPRVSGFFAEDTYLTISTLIKHVNDLAECPHNLRLVTLHLACNIFTSPLFIKEVMRFGNTISQVVVQLVTTSLIDASHPTTRVASASLAFNLAAANYRIRRETNCEALMASEQVELTASLIEVIPPEQNDDALKSMLLALGYLAYHAPQDGETADLCRAMDAQTVLSKCHGQQSLAKEIAGLVG